MSWYFEVLKKYKVFSGRARRKEYWYFALVNSLIFIGLYLLDMAIGPFTFLPVSFNGVEYAGFGLLSGLYGVAVICPCLAVAVRRLHDTGLSGWRLLIGLIPVAGAFVILYFLIQDSHPGENQYGASPKSAEAQAPQAPPPA